MVAECLYEDNHAVWSIFSIFHQVNPKFEVFLKRTAGFFFKFC
jgi:hypothetical protein